MIELKRGDILSEHVEAVVNTVNCVGIMGRGIALQFRKMFPDNYEAYIRACKADQVQPGSMFVYERDRFTMPRIIINFPTRRHWKERAGSPISRSVSWRSLRRSNGTISARSRSRLSGVGWAA